MTLEMACRKLNNRLYTLREACSGLLTTVREDKPLGDSIVFEDTVGDAVDDLLGWLDGGLIAAGEAQQAVEQQTDLNRTWRALRHCQEQYNFFIFRYLDLVSYDQMVPFMRFGQQPDGKWRSWTRSVKAALAQCRQPLYETNQALFECWQEIAERSGLSSVSVQTTNIGQQISVPDEKTLTSKMMA